MTRTAAAVGLVSAALLGLEVSLMRLLQVASWHHFAFLVISIVLLGFGASGTVLTLLRPRALALGERLMWALALGTAVAIPVCCAASQHLPVEARLAPALMWRQLATWLAFWAILAVPFLLGAAAIGLALMLRPGRIGALYGANLLGSAAGAVAAPLVMTLAAPQWLAALFALPALAAAALLARRPRALAVTAAGAAVAAGWLALDPPRVRMDPYKAGSHLARLEAQGDVQCVGRRLGPRALVEAYRGPVLHDLPFLGVDRAPPPVAVLLADGHPAGSVLDAKTPEQAAVMDGTVMALPYAIRGRTARVALLGESGGTDVWLALLHGAEIVDVVQPDANLLRLVTGPLRDHGGAVLERPQVRLHVAEPRHFVEQAGTGTWDMIQLCMMESSAAGSGGAGGLAENHLLTVKGIETCLRRLSPTGVLAVTRGLQTPPRDNVKIMATVLAALRRMGVEDPARHVVVARDFLALCTVVRRMPWAGDEIERVRAAITAANLTPVWFTGIAAGELNQPDYIPPAPVYHDAFVALAGDRAAAFIDGWAFDVRPPTDDRPFFGDFFRFAALGAIRRAYGDQWMTRTELAFAFVLASAVIVAAVGVCATLLPLVVMRSSRDSRSAGGTGGAGRAVTAAYFGCLGLGYLLLEMVFLWRVTYLVGDAVAGAAVTIGGFLLFSGLGSLATQRLRPRAGAVLGTAVAAIVVLGAAQVALLGSVAAAGGALPAAGRWVVALAAIGPPALAMGAPMPMGLRGLPGPLVPWAWGVNGFASVLAPPLAMLAAMTWGYHAVAVAALVLYLAAGGLFARLPAGPECA